MSDTTVDQHQPNIEAIAAKWAANTETPLFTDGPAAQDSATVTDPVTPAQTESAPVPPPAAAPAVEPPITAKQLSLLAEKEAQLLLRARELEQREREFQAQALTREQLIQKLKQQPASVLRELGMSDLGALAGELWAAELGDDAPPEFRQKVQERSAAAKAKELEQRMADLEKQAAESANRAAFQVRVETIDRDMKATLADVPADLKFLRKLASASPEDAYDAMGHIAMQAVKAGQWPSARDIAKQLDEGLRKNWERLRPDDTAATAPQAQQGISKLTPTISSADAADVPDRPNPADQGLQPAEYYIRRGVDAVKRAGGLFTK